MREPGADGYGKKSVPNEKSNEGAFFNRAFLPGNFRMEEIGDKGGDRSGNER